MHAAALGDAIGDILLRQRGDDVATVAVGQVGVEDSILGRARPQEGDHDERDDGGQGDQPEPSLLDVAEGAKPRVEGDYALDRESGP